MVSKMHEVRLAPFQRISTKLLIARGTWAMPLSSLKTQVFALPGGGVGTPHFHTGKPM
jgi:hypothetical protein